MTERVERWQAARRNPQRGEFIDALNAMPEVEVGQGVRVVRDGWNLGHATAHIKADGVEPAAIRRALGIWPEYTVIGAQAVDNAIAIRDWLIEDGSDD